VVVDLLNVHVAGATGDASVQVADTADGTRVTVDTSDRDGRSHSTALSLDPGASVIVGSEVVLLPAGPVYAIGATAPQTIRLSEGSSLYASGSTFGGAIIGYRPRDVVLQGCQVEGAVLVTAYGGRFDVADCDVAGPVRATRRSR
jgi:hypothetical protein